MPDDRDEIRYTATITHDTGGLFETMEDSVEIPVKKIKQQEPASPHRQTASSLDYSL